MSTPPPQKTSRPRWSYPRKPPPRSFATASKIVEYLAKTFPALIDIKKVNVNTAAAKDIETTLELSPETAAAIVRYREQDRRVSGEDLSRPDRYQESKCQHRRRKRHRDHAGAIPGNRRRDRSLPRARSSSIWRRPFPP